MAAAVSIPEADVRKMVRMLASIARHAGSLTDKRRALMTGLCELIDADAWSWIISRASDDNNNPAVGLHLHGGMTSEQFSRSVKVMQDRRNTPVEYAALNQLRLTHSRFTRTWDQLVTREQWYSPRNRALLAQLGFEHVMYSVRVLDRDGLFSGISLTRGAGRENFTPLERRIAHVVIGEVDWLHHDGDLSAVTLEVRPLPPRLRVVLSLLVEGCTVREIATRVGRSYYTINDRMKEIHRHFKVKNRAQLMRRFMNGDGHDVE